MEKFRIEIKKIAQKDLEKHFKGGGKLNLKRIEQIISELSQHPYEGIGQPEPLRYELSGYWSRRINKKDRIVYSVDEENLIVSILSAIGHYQDK